jgi:hypothetical protein
MGLTGTLSGGVVMETVSRRKAIGLVAATVVGAAGAAVAARGADPAKDKGGEGKPLQKMTLKEFLAMKIPAEEDAVLKRLNGGTFMECHTRIREETGIWIPELVPVFQKLDGQLAFKALPKDLN